MTNRSSLNVVIVEDNDVQLDLLKIYVEDCSHTVTGQYQSAEEIIQNKANLDADVILMDINLSGLKNGIQAAKELTDLMGCSIVFITAQTDVEVLEKAAKVLPVDILLKPIDFEQLRASLLVLSVKSGMGKSKIDANERFFINGDELIYRKAHMYEKMKLQEIEYIESLGNYFTLFGNEGRVTLKGTMNELEEHLPKQNFLRISRSFIIQKNAVKSFNAKRVCLTNEKEFTVSRNLKENVLKELLGNG